MTFIQTSQRMLRQIGLAVAISATLLPAASARANPVPGPTAQSQTATAIVRPNPDQQIGQSGSVGPQSLRAARASDLAAAVTKQRSASALETGDNPRGVAIGTHPPKRTLNDRQALANTFAQAPSNTDHALYRPSSPGAGGGSLSTLKAIANTGAADSAASAPPAITAPSHNFDYGAAALGAGITAAIAALIAAGTLGVRQRSRTGHP
jgi:hypothetical protein